MSSKSPCFCLDIFLVFICSSCYPTVKTKYSSLGFLTLQEGSGMPIYLTSPSLKPYPFFKVHLCLGTKILYPTTWIELSPSFPGFNLTVCVGREGGVGTVLNLHESSLQTVKRSTDTRGNTALSFLHYYFFTYYICLTCHIPLQLPPLQLTDGFYWSDVLC